MGFALDRCHEVVESSLSHETQPCSARVFDAFKPTNVFQVFGGSLELALGKRLGDAVAELLDHGREHTFILKTKNGAKQLTRLVQVGHSINHIHDAIAF